MDGVINVNKPSGPTSHDVVAGIRRAIKEKRVGHAGALDPNASGVLIICVGNAVRIVEYLMDWRKAYQAEVVFGAETDTEDETGTVLREIDCSHLTQSMVEAVLPRFTGKIMQVPPMVSSVHHKGKRLYELARKGQVVERAPRSVEIYLLKLVGFEQGKRAKAALEIECSKGTYIRTLCADIGRALDCVAHMSKLVRTGVGRFRMEDAVSIETIEEKAASGRISDILCTIDEALDEMPSATVSETDARLISNGVILSTDRIEEPKHNLPVDAPIKIRSNDGRLLGIGSIRKRPDGETELRPEKVFAVE